MRRAIVTGHSRGIGAALGQQLARAGWEVLGISRSTGLQIDLADPAALASWLACGDLGRFLAGSTEIVLINNAGVLGPATLAGRQQPDTIVDAVNINVLAPMLLSNAVIAERPEGTPLRILHVSSGAGRRPIPGWSVYCATKAALDQHAVTIAAERLPGLRIASVAPGVVDTGMQEQIRGESSFPGRADFVALKVNGQLREPDDAAARLLACLLGADFGDETITAI